MADARYRNHCDFGLTLHRERELAAAFAETELTDPDWRWDHIVAARKKPPAGRNSAEVLLGVNGVMPKEWLKVQVDPLLPRERSRWYDNNLDIAGNISYGTEDIDSLRDTVRPAEKAIALARTLKDYPEGYTEIVLKPDVISTLLPHAMTVRPTCLLLQWDAVLALNDRDPTRAVDDLTAMLNASRSFSDEPLLICQMVRIAARIMATRAIERALGQTEIPDDRLAALQAAWAADAEEPLFLYAMRGERAAYDFMFGNLADGTMTTAVFKKSDIDVLCFSKPGWWLYRARLARDRAFFHRYCTSAVEIARLPIHEQRDAMGRLPPFRVKEEDKELVFSCILLPNVQKFAVNHWRGVAETRCAVVGMACERFRIKTSRWPNSMEELTPGYLSAVPLDPFDGQPLRYVKVDDGVIIASVGSVLPGGTKLEHPGLSNGIEIGFRLWDPSARHQPKKADIPTLDEP